MSSSAPTPNGGNEPGTASGQPEVSASHSADLEALRGEIDRIDRQVVELLARRKRVVEEVVQVKQEHDLPTFHPAREENLISNRREQAASIGLDPDYVEDLFRTVLRHSRVGQLQELGRRGIRPGAKVLIVGGRGSMGKFFARYFEQSDYVVRVLDRDDWGRVRDLVAGIELCMLSVPIELTPEVAEKIAPLLPAGCVLADITSLKTGPLKAMLETYAGPVIGLHPLFGPTTATMDKQIVAVTPGRDLKTCQWLLDQMTVWGNVLVETSAEEHDEIMGIVQALRHFATFAFGQFLHSRGTPIQRTLELSSPIYRLELAMVGRLFAQDPGLYAEIVFASPERLTLLQDYIRSLSENLDIVQRCDKAEFIERFKKISEFFGPFSEQAMRESTFLVDKLVHRF
jgi:chorismate mutase/prephenate dehydrogenase